MPGAQIGVIGMAVMGQNLARNFASHDFSVAVYNRTTERTEEFLAAHEDEGDITGARDIAEFVAALERPRRIIIMVKAGRGTDAVIDQLTPLLSDGDVLIDGGNAHFEDTRRREAALAQHGLAFIGAGISGGEEGALRGPSIMPGGSAGAYAEVGEMLETISAHVDGEPCCMHLGPDGAGHYVKMVHNGIEYADMQLIAEAYDVLSTGAGLGAKELADVFAEWNRGDLGSFLVEITAEVLAHTDEATGGPLVDVILDEASQKGTGRWTAQLGLELGVPITAIAEAVMARSLSSNRDLRQRMAETLSGPDVNGAIGDPESLTEDLGRALYAAKIVAYAQGFAQLAEASDEYGWSLDLAGVAKIWRGGCIVRAKLLERIRAAFDADPNLPSLVLADDVAAALAQAQDAWRRVVSVAATAGIAVPALSSTLAWYDGGRRARLPANLIQAQRDFFGAHTYRRLDRDGAFHTDWTGDRTEARID